MLKIIADDFGLHKLINDGIILGLKEGFINGASLMPIGKEFDDAVNKAKGLDRAAIGIHFVLIEEKPLTLKTLPQNHKTFFIKYILGLISLKSLQKELEAQLNKCIQMGIKPTFINSHQHLHLLPGITDIIVKLAREHQVSYIRIVNEPVNLSGGKLFRKLQLLFLNFLSSMADKKIRKAGLRCNAYFVGFINAGKLGEGDIGKAKELTRKYPDKIIELGCHPGHENEELKIKYSRWGNYNWKKELELLKTRL